LRSEGVRGAWSGPSDRTARMEHVQRLDRFQHEDFLGSSGLFWVFIVFLGLFIVFHCISWFIN
jgi:hypothetical protein